MKHENDEEGLSKGQGNAHGVNNLSAGSARDIAFAAAPVASQDGGDGGIPAPNNCSQLTWLLSEREDGLKCLASLT